MRPAAVLEAPAPRPALLCGYTAQQQPFITMPAAAFGSPASGRRCLPPVGAAAASGRRLQQQQHPLQLQQPHRSRQRPARLQPCAALPEALAALEASPARDVAAAALAVFGSVCLIKFFDTLELMGLIDQVLVDVHPTHSSSVLCQQKCRRPGSMHASRPPLIRPPNPSPRPLPLQRLSRKMVHTLAGPGFLACWPLFGGESYSRLIATAVPALNGLRLLLVGTGVVKDERAVMAVSRTGDPAELLRCVPAALAVGWAGRRHCCRCRRSGSRCTCEH